MEEIFEIFDSNNEPLNITKPRSTVHTENADWHRVTHIWIANGKGEVLCQQRSLSKDKNPGKWQSFFGGHLKAGQTYEDNALSELHEELGISVDREQLKPLYVKKSESAKHFAQIYLLTWTDQPEELHFNDGEVAQVRWLGLKELEDATQRGQFCNSMDEKVREGLSRNR
jgi:isopentenyldiphosphate isomerase